MIEPHTEAGARAPSAPPLPGIGTAQERRQPARPMARWAIPFGILALTLTVVGGYAFHWPWTGVSGDQLWDLLHVIVLPVVLATLPIWYRTRQRWRVEWRLVFGSVAVALATLVVGSYALGWGWTGFQGNTLWDWLELLALPIVVASMPLWFETHMRLRRRWRGLGLMLLLAFSIAIVGGYALGWSWTGFQGNTLRDWLRLLLVPFVLPATLAWFSAREAEARSSSTPAGAGAADLVGHALAPPSQTPG